MKSFSFTAYLSKKESSLAWKYRINIPIDIAETLRTNAKSKSNINRVLCSLNKKEAFQCALTADGNGNFFIVVNKENRLKAAISFDEAIDVVLQNDTSKYGIALPIEMETLLEQDLHGSRIFDSLSPGKQRSLLYIIAKPKNENLRINKAIAILEYLKLVNGKLDFKELNEALKNR